MIIIPARLASSRFPNKVLELVGNLPMVIATAKRVEEIDDVVIATDAKEVIDVANEYGFRAVLTSKDHKSGTDRINEAANILGLSKDEIVINVQADEPFIEKEVVKEVYDRLNQAKKLHEDFMMVSCYKDISKKDADDPNLVKVILNSKNEAIYFSRSKIPYDREGDFDEYFGHIGIYGFLKRTLEEFCSLKEAPLESIEKLEQLRAIYFGKKILMVKVKTASFGIDTKEDLLKALEFLK